MRVILFISFAASLLLGFVRASDNSTLPCRNASVVLPLLKHFSQTDTYSKVEKILGKPDKEVGSGIFIYIFRLNDSTSIWVGTADRNLVRAISRKGRGIKGSQVIFHHEYIPNR